ncbi:E3 ubiquitin-protein ligase RNF213-like [Mytilus edulis]|uniref:E3 ubiquitin-protein ligase RNF213-like n=1 Tax=Mytilus edulis TaxID=6550 RepID=UPI0039EE20F7
MERQIMNRFLFTKSVILLKEIETVMYRFETNAAVFLKLRDRFKQERISVQVLRQIQTDLDQKTFSELCDSIDKLDIAINFLKSDFSDSESLLSDSLVNILNDDDNLVSQKIFQCKYMQCLWMTLTLERTKRRQKNNMESFCCISSAFTQKLSGEQLTALKINLNNFKIEQLDYLSKTIFECLMLTIDMPQKNEEYVDMSKVGLKDAIESYLYDPPYEHEAPTPDWLQIFVNDLPKDGDSRLICCHVVETWVTIHKTLANKRDQML